MQLRLNILQLQRYKGKQNRIGFKTSAVLFSYDKLLSGL
jgi:hypothetical protein